MGPSETGTTLLFFCIGRLFVIGFLRNGYGYNLKVVGFNGSARQKGNTGMHCLAVSFIRHYRYGWCSKKA